MRLVKHFLFAYLGLIVLAVVGYLVARAFSPVRDPETIYTVYVSSVRSLDPVKIADVNSADIGGHVYETLYNYRYGGRPDELFPQLAAAMPEVSPDRLTYTLRLRPGVRFYDPRRLVWADGVGPAVTARDVVFSWKRLADFHTAAPSYSTVFEGNIVGLDAWRKESEGVKEAEVDYDKPVEGLIAVDDLTVRVKLTKPVPQFTMLMAYLGTAVVSREAVEKLGTLGETPIGTGPYAITEYRNEERIVMEANPVYRGAPDIDGGVGAAVNDLARIPKTRRIQWDYIQESLPAWYLFVQGRYDSMSIPKETFSDVITKDKTLAPEFVAKGMELRIRPDLGLYYIQFNMTDPVIGRNKPLRQAMSLGFDRDTYLRVYRNNRGKPGTGVLPPDAPLYDPAYRSPWHRFDPNAARAKVKEAQAVHGGPLPTLKLQMWDSDTETRQQAEFFARQMREIGLSVEPEYNTYARYLERMDAKDYQLAWAGWYPDYPDEKTYLKLFDARLAKPPGSNSSGFDDERYQSLLTKAEVLERSPQRDALYLGMRDIIDEELPVFVLFYPEIYGLRYTWIGNVQPVYFTAGFMAHHRLDVGARRKALGG